MFRKKKSKFEGTVQLKPLKYPPKILLGWAEAIGGNKDLRDWFLESEDFKELGLFVHALLLKQDAREWLMENGYAHLMAMINGAEGSKEAIHWLDKAGFLVLKNVALSGDNDEDAFEWLTSNGHEEFAMISMQIRKIKNEIEDDHEDIHKFGRD
jgi:hypothetical protein